MIDKPASAREVVTLANMDGFIPNPALEDGNHGWTQMDTDEMPADSFTAEAKTSFAHLTGICVHLCPSVVSILMLGLQPPQFRQ